MFRAILWLVGLAVALTLLGLVTGYFDYRRAMNSCIDAGGVVIKTSAGLKCVPRGQVRVI